MRFGEPTRLMKVRVIYAKEKAKYYRRKKVAHKWMMRYEAWVLFVMALAVIGIPFILAL